MDIRLGADIDAARRFIHDQHPRRRRQPLAEHHLLLIAAGQLAHDLLGPPRPYAEIGNRFPGLHRHPCGVDENPAHQPLENGQGNVFRNRLRPDQALQAAVFRHIGDTEVARRFRAGNSDRFAIEQDFAVGCRRYSENRQGQFGAARSHETGDAKDLAALEFKGNAAHDGLVRYLAQFKQRLAALALLLGIEPVDGAADHHRDQRGLVNFRDVPGANMIAIAQHRHPVGESKNFRQAMTDIDDGDAARLELAHDIHQALHVGFGQCRRRLIHDQDPRFLGQGPGNLDPLPVGDRKRADPRIDIEFGTIERIEYLAAAVAHPVPVEAAP